MQYKLYEVGGHVRDTLLGIPSKDIDYTVVIEGYDDELKAFHDFSKQIAKDGFEIFLETPDCLTLRAKFPNSKEVADFVLARKEVYTAGSRTPITELGSLEDDLLRRDFTVNALAKDSDGIIIDIVNGITHLNQGILKTPVDTFVSFHSDPLRVLRAIRFKVTKGFEFSDDITRTLHYFPVSCLSIVSEERIREELSKCFHHSTAKTMRIFQQLDRQGIKIGEWIFDNTNIWLEPTNKK